MCIKFDEEQHTLNFNVPPHKWLIIKGKTVTFKRKNLADTSLTKRSKWPSLIKGQWSCATRHEPLRSTNHWQGFPARTPFPELDHKDTPEQRGILYRNGRSCFQNINVIKHKERLRKCSWLKENRDMTSKRNEWFWAGSLTRRNTIEEHYWKN